MEFKRRININRGFFTDANSLPNFKSFNDIEAKKDL